ncbi:NUDIX hydrolase [Sandaracinobacteroides hominis]|uniref:NUDIX hydrolase n=1 Tax=Sandaracinobacteroides hominis TaxID=2780086 RepID=UPI002E2A461D|nr:NUDIX hydrolase [Sandaracinobacteroides hominis]
MSETVGPDGEGRPVWQGKFLQVQVVPWGDGGQWEFVKRARGIQAAVILALTDAHEIVLVEQYRPALSAQCIELPAGLVGDVTHGEEVFASARRELMEETGFEAAHWEPFGEFASSPGMVGEIFHFYRATGLKRVGPGGGVDNEGIVVHVVPVSGLWDFIAAARARGCVIDTRLLIALSLV